MKRTRQWQTDLGEESTDCPWLVPGALWSSLLTVSTPMLLVLAACPAAVNEYLSEATQGGRVGWLCWWSEVLRSIEKGHVGTGTQAANHNAGESFEGMRVGNQSAEWFLIPHSCLWDGVVQSVEGTAGGGWQSAAAAGQLKIGSLMDFHNKLSHIVPIDGLSLVLLPLSKTECTVFPLIPFLFNKHLFCSHWSLWLWLSLCPQGVPQSWELDRGHGWDQQC